MKTKAFILIGLMALLLLTACSSGDVVPEPNNGNGNPIEQPQYPIGFTGVFADSEGGTASAPATRGVGDGEFTNTELQASGFGVYCWYTGEDDFTTPLPTTARDGSTEPYVLLMQNQHVTYSGGQWTYAPSKYWPLKDTEKLTFRAYAPYVSYLLQMDDYGMPMLPVVVKATDYHDGTQHDPLWGTGRHGGSDATVDADGTTYGELYNNYTYVMSGNDKTQDARDGVIDWYFHHGMAKLMFTCSVIQDPGCDKITIMSITIEHIYTQGLLSLSSPTSQASDKPIWDDESLAGNETVILGADDLAANPFEITTSSSAPSEPVDLLTTEKGLLIIPRDYTLPDGLTITITYSVDTDPTELVASSTIHPVIEGNTCYTMNLSLTPSTKGLEISIVQSAFSTWNEGGEIDRTVYNW